jgi:hypothetical protein
VRRLRVLGGPRHFWYSFLPEYFSRVPPLKLRPFLASVFW